MSVNFALNLFLAFASENQCPLSSNNWYPHEDLSSIQETNFDFIIVGGGTAGSVLANRLSEIPQWNVLLIEAGGLPPNFSEIPSLSSMLAGSEIDWSFHAESLGIGCKGYENEKCAFPQGKVLGGTSTINGLLTTEPNPQDFDSWSEMGLDQWSWQNVEPYYEKLNAFLSENGPVKSTLYTSEIPTRQLLQEAFEELQVTEFHDVNISAYEGQRFSMAKAYLKPVLNQRENLKLLVNHKAVKLLFEDSKVIGLEVQSNDDNQITRILTNGEIIVSAGGINSPKLLMLSGIGPQDHLQSLGIPLVSDLPSVGKLKDHFFTPIFITLPSNLSFDQNLQQSFQNYCANRSDLNNSGTANYQGFFSVDSSRANLEIIQNTFPTNGTVSLEGFMNWVQINSEISETLKEINKNQPLMVVFPFSLHPMTEGVVKLQDNNPNCDPVIQQDLYSHPKDLKIIFGVFDFYEQVVQTVPFRGSQIYPIPPCNQHAVTSEEYRLCHIDQFGSGVYHETSSCTMGLDRSNSVVDQNLKVHGIDNLRIIDASSVPDLFTGHPNIPICLFAERASDLIKQQYNSE